MKILIPATLGTIVAILGYELSYDLIGWVVALMITVLAGIGISFGQRRVRAPR